MSSITLETDKSFYELHKCVEVDENGQSQAHAIWHSCSDVCQDKYQSLAAQCGGCEDPTMFSFLQDAASKLLKCVTDTNGCDSIKPAIQKSCCPPKDTECNNHTGYPPTCHNAICAKTVLQGSTRCPDTYLHDSRLLGFFADCGGDLVNIGVRATSLPDATFCPSQSEHHQDIRRSLIDLVVNDTATFRQLNEHDSASWLAHGASAACVAGYENVMKSALTGGACSLDQCNTECQRTITGMLQGCRSDIYDYHLEDDTIVQKSWGARVATMTRTVTPSNCSFWLGFGGCDISCSVSNAGHTLGSCGRWGANYKLEGLNSCSDECKSDVIDFATRCQSCSDPEIVKVIEIASAALVSTTCLPSCDGVQGDDNPADAVQSVLQELCCLTTNDCRMIGRWYLPPALPRPGCAAAVKSAALHACPDIFFHDSVALGFFSDCDGDLFKLLQHGSACEMPTELPKWATKGNCPAPGATLASGQYCQYFCEKGWCLSGTPPTCFAGRLQSKISCQPTPEVSCMVRAAFTQQFGPTITKYTRIDMALCRRHLMGAAIC
jgi:hypothetical protein